MFMLCIDHPIEVVMPPRTRKSEPRIAASGIAAEAPANRPQAADHVPVPTNGDGMVVIAFVGQKGGSGKTTLALAMADVAIDDGLAVSMIDLDPQRSSEQWSDWHHAESRGASELVTVHGTSVNLDKMLAAARGTATDLVLIDTPGQLDKTLVYAAAASHLAVVPTRTGILDKFALAETLDYLKRIGGVLGRTIVVVNAPSRDTSGRDEILAVARHYGVPVAAVAVDDDAEIAAALREGKGIFTHVARRKLGKSLRALFAELIEAAARTAGHAAVAGNSRKGASR
jgi:chromosome partitioning protein